MAGGAEWEGRVELGLMQRFPLTARLRLEKEISALEIEAARCEIEDQERILTAQVRAAWFWMMAVRLWVGPTGGPS